MMPMAQNWFTRSWQFLSGSRPPVVGVLRLNGAIGMRTGLSRGLSLSSVAADLDRLFADRSQAAVAILVNSPGGSPVQAGLIHDRIRALSAESGVKVLTFAEDVAASGGYMLSIAGDEVFAHENSVVGSIGVVSAGFGFQDLIAKIGVERRVHTSGTRKAMLDPFRPEVEEDVRHLRELQAEVHESFKAMVRARRNGRLSGDEADLFSGMFWTGAKALKFGLIDGIGDMRSICRRKFGDTVEFRVIQPRRSWFGGSRLAAMASQPGDRWAESLVSSLEERALWSRFGL
jgi:signal peptide peptidase SppA